MDIVKDLVETVMSECGIEDYSVDAEFSAVGLEGKNCTHPFIERDSLMMLADYVTTEAGTGCVHTAPGHGADDYITGLRYGLEVLSPVDNEGIYTAEAGPYEGKQVPYVNKEITADMSEAGSLIHETKLQHSHPHCWRCKKPVMYRATPQWFIAMENNNLREKAMKSINEVTWTPAWGMQRILSMVEGRPDWCLSRQRSWGVPITVISCKSCGEIVRNKDLNEKIDELYKKEGADAWFRYDVDEFLPAGVVCSCGKTEFQKENDILDVWFDSGASHAAVCEEREELRAPADLYLEGSDQHRGWFQSSLLTSVGTRGHAPFKGVLTHGYVVDGKGKKMSKSVGNVVAPSEVIEKYGAEILRLWVSSEDYRDDIKVSDEILKQVSDSYRKVRNTIRYMLGNLSDFNPETDMVAFDDMQELDRWAITRYAEFLEKVKDAYDKFEFHSIHQNLNYFCGTTMSAFYLDIIKDRLYTEGTDSTLRRAAQSVLFQVLDGMLKIMSPVLSFTACEAWESLYKLDDKAPLVDSILFQEFPQPVEKTISADEQARWDRLISIRSELTKALEIARRNKVIGHPLEAEVLLNYTDSNLSEFLEKEWHNLKGISIISEMTKAELSEMTDLEPFSSEDIDGLTIAIRPAPGEKCDRCWIRSTTVGDFSDHPLICDRCLGVVAEIDKSV